MNGIAVEDWDSKKKLAVMFWLMEHYGEPSQTTWYVDSNYFTEDLMLNNEIYPLFVLRWV